MRRRPHPCLPVPAAERVRLSLAAHEALAHVARADRLSKTDLRALALIVADLADPARLDGAAEARQAAQAALQALDAAEAGTTPWSAVAARCAGAVAAFEALLEVTTWRRLQDAQIAAVRRLEPELA